MSPRKLPQDVPIPFALPGPTGGVNTHTYSTELQPNKYEMLKNLEFAFKYGAFASRKGYTAYNGSTIASNRITGGIRWYYGSSSKELIVACGNKLYSGNDGAGTFAQIGSSTFTADKEWYFAAYTDICYGVNGVDAVQRRDGPNNTLRAAGYAAPVTAPNVSVSGSGNLTGRYKYKVTFVYDSNAAHESSAGPASLAAEPSAQQVNLTNIPTGGTGCTSRNIYRTKAGGSDYFFLASIADNATTTYTDKDVAATGTIADVSGANHVDGETVTISDGVHEPTVFEYDSNGSVTAGRVAVTFAGGDSAATIHTALINAINGVGANLEVTASDGGGSTVNLVNDTKGAAGNVAISETVANGSYTVTGMSGGQSASDASMSTSKAPTDNGIPPTGAQFVVLLRGRMILARTPSQPQRLFLSSITNTEKSPDGSTTTHGADIEIFPALHWIDIGDDNSPITGLAVLSDLLVVFKEDGIYTIQGDSAGDMTVYKVGTPTGCIAPRSIENVGQYIYFLGRNDGWPTVYKFDGTRAYPISMEIEPTLTANVKDLGNVSSEPIQPCAVNYRGQYILAYRKVGGGSEVAVACECPGQTRWAFWDGMQPSVFFQWNGRGDAGEIYFGSAQEGRVLRMDNGFTDYGTGTPAVVTSVVETKWLDLGLPYVMKQIDHIEVYGKANTKGRLTVERRFDFNGSGVASDVYDMSTVLTGKGIFKCRIDCGASEQATPEQCLLLKLVLSFYGSDTGIADHIEIYRIVVWFTPQETLEFYTQGSGTGIGN